VETVAGAIRSLLNTVVVIAPGVWALRAGGLRHHIMNFREVSYRDRLNPWAKPRKASAGWAFSRLF
jgi:hypothetical protein